MAVYATQADLANYGLSSAKVAALIASLGSGALDAELAAVSSEADSVLRKFATLPLTSWDVVLTQKVCHIAAYNLVTADGYNPDAPGDNALKLRAQAAEQWFDELAAGARKLGYADSSPFPQVSPVFSGDLPRGWGCGNL